MQLQGACLLAVHKKISRAADFRPGLAFKGLKSGEIKELFAEGNKFRE